MKTTTATSDTTIRTAREEYLVQAHSASTATAEELASLERLSTLMSHRIAAYRFEQDARRS